MRKVLLMLSAIVLPALCVSGMDRLDALSQIESRNNDLAIGAQKEVSRFQILPAFWQQAHVVWRPTDPSVAGIVVSRIMEARSRVFEARYHRAPTDFEYYILWHRPACLIGRRVPRQLTSVEKERGRRFASLCQGGG
jgi:hypothetical protein